MTFGVADGEVAGEHVFDGDDKDAIDVQGREPTAMSLARNGVVVAIGVQ